MDSILDNRTDLDLVKASRQGDSGAWRTLIERYQRLVFFIANQRGLTREDGDELVQMTFTTMLENLHVFHENSNVKSWLGTVARRHSYRYLRRYDQEQVMVKGDLRASTLLENQSAEMDNHWELAQWLHDGLDQLNDRCRQLLLALYFEERSSYSAVAKQLNIRLGSIGPTRARCLAKLREILDQ